MVHKSVRQAHFGDLEECIYHYKDGEEGIPEKNMHSVVNISKAYHYLDKNKKVVERMEGKGNPTTWFVKINEKYHKVKPDCEDIIGRKYLGMYLGIDEEDIPEKNMDSMVNLSKIYHYLDKNKKVVERIERDSKPNVLYIKIRDHYCKVNPDCKNIIVRHYTGIQELKDAIKEYTGTKSYKKKE